MKEGTPTQGYGSDLGEIIVAARGHGRGPGWSTEDGLLGATGLGWCVESRLLGYCDPTDDRQEGAQWGAMRMGMLDAVQWNAVGQSWCTESHPLE